MIEKVFKTAYNSLNDHNITKRIGKFYNHPNLTVESEINILDRNEQKHSNTMYNINGGSSKGFEDDHQFFFLESSLDPKNPNTGTDHKIMPDRYFAVLAFWWSSSVLRSSLVALKSRRRLIPKFQRTKKIRT